MTTAIPRSGYLIIYFCSRLLTLYVQKQCNTQVSVFKITPVVFTVQYTRLKNYLVVQKCLRTKYNNIPVHAITRPFVIFRLKRYNANVLCIRKKKKKNRTTHTS